MKRVVANYGRPHANKRPIETVGAGARPKRSRSPVAADAAKDSSSADPLVQHALAAGPGFGSYVDKLVGSQAAGMPSGADSNTTRQLKEHLKEQLEAEERRAAGTNPIPAVVVGAATDSKADAMPKFCDTEVQTIAYSCPLIPTATSATVAVQVDPVWTVAIETQTDLSPEPQPDPAVNCATQTDSPPVLMCVDHGCQCDDIPVNLTIKRPSDAPLEQAGADEASEDDPFAFTETEENTASPTPEDDGSVQKAQARQAEDVARRKEELLAESAKSAEHAALVEATEAAAKAEKAQSQIVSLEFANDVLMQQVGETKDQLKRLGDKELAARQALAKLQQDHAKEVERWQTMMDSTVQSVQGQMSQLLQGTTQKIAALQQQVQHKDAQISQLRQQCADLEASATAHRQAAEAAAAQTSADELSNDAEMDADAIFAAVDSVEEEEEEEEEEAEDER